MPPQRSVTLDRLGAWVIKCNPRRTALGPMVAAGASKPRWCVADNYRTRLFAPGQRVLLWVTTHPQRGVWGDGRITGDVVADADGLHVPVDIPLLAEPVVAGRLSAIPGLASMEVFRSPQQANPSWVSVTELALIAPLLDGRGGTTEAG